MKKTTIIILTLASLYLALHFGRLYEYRNTQEAIDNAMEKRLATCLDRDYNFTPSDWCLYGQGGYEVKP
ncbi:MAG: hypothetical protein Q8O75_01140 [bacterium]|nr:hypothetical protein [bacterium]